MRPARLFAALSLALPAAAAAQTVPATLPAPRVGLLVGVNSATQSTEADDADIQRRTGVVAGGYLTLPFARYFAFRPEVLYSQKGASGREEDVRVSLNLDYVEVPLLVQATVPTSGRVRPQLYAGPALGIRVRCQIAGSGGGVSVSLGCDDATDLTGEDDLGLRRFDLGGMVGGALAFDVGRQTLTVGARYTHGFTSVVDEADGSRNRVISVYGSLELPFGRARR